MIGEWARSHAPPFILYLLQSTHTMQPAHGTLSHTRTDKHTHTPRLSMCVCQGIRMRESNHHKTNDSLDVLTRQFTKRERETRKKMCSFFFFYSFSFSFSEKKHLNSSTQSPLCVSLSLCLFPGFVAGRGVEWRCGSCAIACGGGSLLTLPGWLARAGSVWTKAAGEQTRCCRGWNYLVQTGSC